LRWRIPAPTRPRRSSSSVAHTFWTATNHHGNPERPGEREREGPRRGRARHRRLSPAGTQHRCGGRAPRPRPSPKQRSGGRRGSVPFPASRGGSWLLPPGSRGAVSRSLRGMRGFLWTASGEVACSMVVDRVGTVALASESRVCLAGRACHPISHTDASFCLPPHRNRKGRRGTARHGTESRLDLL